jgi:D-3-phosphoglycerate dehydrogenase
MPFGARRGPADEALLAASLDADVALGVNLPSEAMASAKALRAIVTTSIGLERVDIEAATKLGILVCNSPSLENVTGVAEATIGFLVALSKRMKSKEASLRVTGWGNDSDRGILLAGRTLGLVGLGRIGSGVAERLRGWGMRLISYSPHTPTEHFSHLGVERVENLDDIFRQSDFVSVHVVATPETERFIGEKQLRLMKAEAYLVNTSRGQVIDEIALERALREEWFAGAALDVFADEPLASNSPLRDLDPDRVILTPHAISHTRESREGGLRMAIESTLTILEGNVPATVANPEAVPVWRHRFRPGNA